MYLTDCCKADSNVWRDLIWSKLFLQVTQHANAI